MRFKIFWPWRFVSREQVFLNLVLNPPHARFFNRKLCQHTSMFTGSSAHSFNHVFTHIQRHIGKLLMGCTRGSNGTVRVMKHAIALACNRTRHNRCSTTTHLGRRRGIT